MYEKTMYKVPRKDNKVIFRLQDFTKNDNVDESVFIEGQDNKGNKRLQCQVKVLHVNEYEAIFEELEQANLKVEELNNKIKQQNNEIKRLQSAVDEYEQANKDEEFNILLETRRLEKQHQDDVDELKETHKNQLLAIGETHKENIIKLQAQYNAKLDDSFNELVNEIKENDNERDKIQGDMLAMKETHKQEIITLQNEHHEEVKTIQHEHSNELQALQEKHAYDIDTLKQALADNKQEHLVEIHEIKEKHHDEVDEIRTSFLSLLATEHAKDMSDFNECGELPFYIKPFARGFVKAFNEFKQRKEMNAPQKIVETYKLEGEKEKE